MITPQEGNRCMLSKFVIIIVHEQKLVPRIGACLVPA